MKQTLTILITFIVLFAESLLLDIPFVARNFLRVAIVVLLFIVTIWMAYRIIQVQSTPKKNN